MAWVFIILAGLLETVWAYYLKQSEGFTKPGASAIMLAAMIGSFGLLSVAMRTMPLGTAYAAWTGIGAVGAFMIGWLVLGERASATGAVAIAMIVAGVLLLKVAEGDGA